ncbi:MAG: hypothetical protein Q8O95_03755 [bacterium]|nr:hypothetical protein [bacterium]
MKRSILFAVLALASLPLLTGCASNTQQVDNVTGPDNQPVDNEIGMDNQQVKIRELQGQLQNIKSEVDKMKRP